MGKYESFVNVLSDEKVRMFDELFRYRAIEYGTADTIKIFEKVLLVTHTDFDGTAPAVVINYVDPQYKSKAMEVMFVENKDLNNKLIEVANDEYFEGFTVFIVDHCPTFDTFNLLKSKGMNVFVFDHHEKTELINSTDKNVFINLDHCGTKIFFHFLHRILGVFDLATFFALSDFVDVVNDYDMWIHDDPRSKEINTLLWEMGKEDFILRFTHNLALELNTSERYILELAQRRNNKYVNTKVKSMTPLKDYNDRTFAFCFADTLQSEIGDNAKRVHKLDYVYIINPSMEKVSIRSGNGFNARDLAKCYALQYNTDCGGHPASAGFTLPLSKLTHFLDGLTKMAEDVK